MTTVLNLRESCRGEPWDRNTGPGQPFEFDAETVQGGKVMFWVKHNDEPCWELYRNFQRITAEVDAARWLPIFEACVAKCKESLAITCGRGVSEEIPPCGACEPCRAAEAATAGRQA